MLCHVVDLADLTYLQCHTITAMITNSRWDCSQFGKTFKEICYREKLHENELSSIQLIHLPWS